MEVLLHQPELSQVPNKSQRLLHAKFDYISNPYTFINVTKMNYNGERAGLKKG